MNRHLSTHSSEGTALKSLLLGAGALSAGEWNVPLLGKYEDLPMDERINDPDKEGIILLDWRTWMEQGPHLASTKAFGQLLPMAKEIADGKGTRSRLQPLC